MCGILTIVEGELLAARDVPLGKEADARQVRVEAVDPHVEYGQVRICGWKSKVINVIKYTQETERN